MALDMVLVGIFVALIGLGVYQTIWFVRWKRYFIKWQHHFDKLLDKDNDAKH